MIKKHDTTNRVGIATILLSFIMWVFIWYTKFPTHKVCAMFALFVILFLQILFYNCKCIMSLGVGTRCFIHCTVTIFLVIVYSFVISNKPLSDSFFVSLRVLVLLLIKYGYENLSYYDEL